jgi:integrase
MRVIGVVTDLAFPSPAGLPMASGTYNRGLKQVLKRVGIKGRVTTYSLRYGFATLALLAGELDKTVSEQMGHTRVNFTKEVYAKVLPEMRRSLSDKLERLLFADARTRLAHSESAEVM